MESPQLIDRSPQLIDGSGEIKVRNRSYLECVYSEFVYSAALVQMVMGKFIYLSLLTR
jgi:hypothetical protein